MSIYYFCDHIEGEKGYFDEHETQHLRVMRQSEGEDITFTDGRGNLFSGRLALLKKGEAIVKITGKREDLDRELTKTIRITAGISKWNRLALLLEKAVELGVRKIALVRCERSNFPKIHADKVNKTLRKALKQCGGTVLPTVDVYDSFHEATNTHMTAVLLNPYTNHSITEYTFPDSVNLFIGPEGGFTDAELKMIRTGAENLIEVSMGKRILRLETAAIAAMAFIAIDRNEK